MEEKAIRTLLGDKLYLTLKQFCTLSGLSMKNALQSILQYHFDNIIATMPKLEVKDILSYVEPRHKEWQLDIIQKTNPAPETPYAWIRDIQDIHTFAETLEDTDICSRWETDGIASDFSTKDIKNALGTGRIKIYSSNPIRHGMFVTPSKKEAEAYAGSSQVYYKTVWLNEVAWIDSLQGQYTGLYEKESEQMKENSLKYYEVCFPLDDNGEEPTLCIKGWQKPTIEEATAFLASDIKSQRLGNVTEIIEITKKDAENSYDFSNGYVVFGKPPMEDLVEETVDWFLSVLGGSANPEKTESLIDLYVNDFVRSTYTDLSDTDTETLINEAIARYQILG